MTPVSKAEKRRNAKLAKRVKRHMQNSSFDWTRLHYILNHDTDDYLTDILETLCNEIEKGDSSCS